MKTYTVAILGATGAVGQEMMKVLEERNFPVGKLILLASARSAGRKLLFKGASSLARKRAREPLSCACTKLLIPLLTPVSAPPALKRCRLWICWRMVWRMKWKASSCR